MLLGKDDKVIGHSPAELWHTAVTHMNAYQHDDIDLLMTTVSSRGGIWSGLLPSQGAVIMRTAAEIRDNYTKALAAVKIGGVEAYVAVASDWYVFAEAVTTVTDKASSQEFQVQGVGFYGADNQGLAMDTDVGSLLAGAGVADSGPARLAVAKAHERRLQTLAAGTVDDAVLAEVAETMDLFLPVFDPNDSRLQQYVGGRDGFRNYARGFTAMYEVEDAGRLNLLTTSSYVFSEVDWALRDRRTGEPGRVRFALCEVIGPDGLVRGGVGVATRH